MVHPFGSMSCLQPSLASLSHAHNLEITILIPDLIPTRMYSDSNGLEQRAANDGSGCPRVLAGEANSRRGVAVKPDQKSQAGVA